MNGRVYEPIIGRFLGVDPIVQVGNSQSPNSYTYVWNNPLTLTDPSGFTTDNDKTVHQCISCDWRSIFDAWAIKEFMDTNGWLDYREPTIDEKRSWVLFKPGDDVDIIPPNAVSDGKSFGGPQTMFGAQSETFNPLLCARTGICTPQPSISITINDVTDFSAGLGDILIATASLGNSDAAEYRAYKDLGSVDTTSAAYQIGYWGGVAVTLGLGRLFAGGPAARGVRQAGRSLDDVIGNPETFNRWLKHSHPTNRPLQADDARKVWDKLLETGKIPRLDPGHPGTKWDMPHINVDGTHIPVDAGFTPPVP